MGDFPRGPLNCAMTDFDAMSFFDQNEERDGIRFSWNNWPASKQEAMKAVIPVGCLYSPLKQNPNTPIVNYEPVLCSGSCRTILNPHCDIDFASKIWTCPFCYRRNQFPAHYSGISETNLTAESIPRLPTNLLLDPREMKSLPLRMFLWKFS